MAESSPRRRAPVLPQTRPASAVQPLSGGRRMITHREPDQHRQKNRAAKRSQHSSDERAVLALCAVAVAMVTGLVVFTILRDSTIRDQSAPLVVPLNP